MIIIHNFQTIEFAFNDNVKTESIFTHLVNVYENGSCRFFPSLLLYKFE